MLFTWESSFFSTYKSCVSVSWFLCLFRKRYYCFLYLDYLSFVLLFPQCSTMQQYCIFSKKLCLVTSFSCVLWCWLWGGSVRQGRSHTDVSEVPNSAISIQGFEQGLLADFLICGVPVNSFLHSVWFVPICHTSVQHVWSPHHIPPPHRSGTAAARCVCCCLLGWRYHPQRHLGGACAVDGCSPGVTHLFTLSYVS